MQQTRRSYKGKKTNNLPFWLLAAVVFTIITIEILAGR